MKNNKEFYDYFKNMAPMKYYEGDLTKPKAIEMLANTDNRFFAMRKYDGEWSRVIIGEEEVLFQSRSISKVTGTYGDKTELVPHIAAELLQNWPAGTVLLGELAFDDFESNSNNVGSILRCKPPKAIARQEKKKIHLFVFDVLAFDYEILVDKPFEERFLPYDRFSKYVQVAQNHSGQDANFLDYADWIWKRGGEGIMIVRKDMKYTPGTRTAWQTLKVKKKLGEITAPIVNFLEPTRVYEGTEIRDWKFYEFELEDGSVYKKDISDSFNQIPAGLDPVQYEDIYIKEYTNLKIVKAAPVTKPYYYGWKSGVTINYKGKEIKVASGMTDEYRAWLASDAALELLNTGRLTATITGMEETADSIRHPVLLKINKE